MKVADLIRALSEYPSEASVELGKAFSIKTEGDIDSGYEVIFDFPVSGLAYSEQDNDVRFIFEHNESLDMFGKIKLFSEPPVIPPI